MTTTETSGAVCRSDLLGRELRPLLNKMWACITERASNITYTCVYGTIIVNVNVPHHDDEWLPTKSVTQSLTVSTTKNQPFILQIFSLHNRRDVPANTKLQADKINNMKPKTTVMRHRTSIIQLPEVPTRRSKVIVLGIQETEKVKLRMSP